MDNSDHFIANIDGEDGDDDNSNDGILVSHFSQSPFKSPKSLCSNSIQMDNVDDLQDSNPFDFQQDKAGKIRQSNPSPCLASPLPQQQSKRHRQQYLGGNERNITNNVDHVREYHSRRLFNEQNNPTALLNKALDDIKTSKTITDEEIQQAREATVKFLLETANERKDFITEIQDLLMNNLTTQKSKDKMVKDTGCFLLKHGKSNDGGGGRLSGMGWTPSLLLVFMQSSESLSFGGGRPKYISTESLNRNRN